MKMLNWEASRLQKLQHPGSLPKQTKTQLSVNSETKLKLILSEITKVASN